MWLFFVVVYDADEDFVPPDSGLDGNGHRRISIATKGVY
jgi:hypothetical protein